MWHKNSASDRNTVKTCVVYNNSYSGIWMADADDNYIVNCKVYADDNSTGLVSSCDYYYLITNSDDNLIKNCDAERHPDYFEGQNPSRHLAHQGHGFVVQGLRSGDQVSTGNTYSGCNALNMRDVILLRGLDAQYNTFKAITSEIVEEQETSSSPLYGGYR
ncbi:MAG: right-handed parallel beta-helix repeat-containing protein [Pirellulaceae bacterium]